MYKIVVEELSEKDLLGTVDRPPVERYRQVIDTLDIGKLAAFLNSKPRKRRAPKEKT